MAKTELNWSKVSWEEFQELCIPLANKHFPDGGFHHFLNPGQKQDGIDLHDKKAQEKTTCFQCKHKVKITKSQLNKLIKEFTDNEFVKKTKLFILATTADLQGKDIGAALEVHKAILKREYSVDFEWWDVATIETKLKERKSIVKRFFSPHEADTFCFPELRRDALEKTERPGDYIQRVIKSFIPNNVPEREFSWDKKEDTFNLTDLLVKDRKLDLARICLVGDPYQGKSSYLNYCAYILKNEYEVETFKLEVKNVNPQPIDRLLSIKYDYWEDTPTNKVVVFIDGLDEAPSESFQNYSSYINEFVSSNPNTTIVFSCRKYFYEEYQLQEHIKGFELYELFPLNYYQIDSYIKELLPDEWEAFWKEVQKRSLEPILYYPFYLTYLVKKFKNGRQKFPENKVAALNEFIETEFNETTSKRKLANGKPLHSNKILYNKAIQSFAFALQLSGKNSFITTEVRDMFSKRDIELLEHSSLIFSENGVWSFVNALFQEHLAALKLSELPVDQIIDYVSVGKQVKKVKTKWIQTFCTMLSFVEESNERDQLIDVLKKDNPELIFNIDRTKYSVETRQEFLEVLIERCENLNIRLQNIHESAIANFIEDSSDSIEYLITTIGSDKRPVVVKTICAKIIENLKLNDEQRHQVYEVIQRQMLVCNDSYFAKHLFEILLKENLGSKTDVDAWINLPLNEKHEFRDKMYDFIIFLELIDTYYDYGLEGIKTLILYNKHIIHSLSEQSLEKFLLETGKRKNLKKLFSYILTPGWIEFADNQATQFFDKIFKRLYELIIRNPLFAFEITDFIESINKTNLRHRLNKIDSSVDDGLASNFLLRLVISRKNDLLEDLTWSYGALVPSNNYDLIFSEFEEGRLSLKDLRSLSHGYLHNNRANASEFHKLCLDVTENQLYPPSDNEEFDWAKLNQKREENDLVCLQSFEAFKQFVKRTFKVFGKKKISSDELYIDSHSKPNRQQIASDLVYWFLRDRERSDNSVYLEDLQDVLNNDEWFEIFRVGMIMQRNLMDSPADNLLIRIVQDYYNEKIKSVDFENCEWLEADGFIHCKTLERRLVAIFEKFKFPTDTKILIDMIWAAHGPINRTEIKAENQMEALPHLIVERLSSAELEVFKDKLVENIRIGIKSKQALKNHIGLCKYYKIKEAKDLIFGIAQSKRLDEYYTSSCFEIYIELGGAISKVENIFNRLTDFNSILFEQLVNLLKDRKPETIKKRLLEALDSPDLQEDKKMLFAKYLANLKVDVGFALLADFVRKNKKSPYTIQGHTDVHFINTDFALEQLKGLMHMVLEPEKLEESFTTSAKSILIEWILGLASKSEEDLIKVEEFLVEARDTLSKKYSDAITYFNWYIGRIPENFCKSEKLDKTVKELR